MTTTLTNDLRTALEETISLLNSFGAKEANTVPFEGSWTAAQVGRHLLKSETGMDELLLAPSQPAGRKPDEQEGMLKQTFLDFSKKFQSPDFILPEDREYDMAQLTKELAEAKEKMFNALPAASLEELAPLPEGHPLAGITKLEVLYFVTYHTMRHNNQIRKIKEVLE